ncbi:MAG TPA: MBL fold metallo-hydrolase [Candidatus Didemnitutus sp.]|nr:MBL fold metallo-hydrolase [Candidatus Didemnitutus sp.]
MKVHALPSGPIDTVGYLLLSSERGEAVLIDAPEGILRIVAPILAREKCRLGELWLTHGHWDHTQDAARLKREFGLTVRAHAADRELIENPSVMEEFMEFDLELEPVAIDSFVSQGDVLTALGRSFEVRHVPGHCPGNVLFYQAEARGAWVGDALFRAGVGRWDLPGGDLEILTRSIREQIYSLPDETRVFPGHGPHTTVGEEKRTNPYVAAE